MRVSDASFLSIEPLVARISSTRLLSELHAARSSSLTFSTTVSSFRNVASFTGLSVLFFPGICNREKVGDNTKANAASDAIIPTIFILPVIAFIKLTIQLPLEKKRG